MLIRRGLQLAAAFALSAGFAQAQLRAESRAVWSNVSWGLAATSAVTAGVLWFLAEEPEATK